MSHPDNTGPLDQLMKSDLTDLLGWHQFEVRSPNGGKAGRWSNDMIQGQWTFKVDFGRVFFWIKEDCDAMLFKLTWGGVL